MGLGPIPWSSVQALADRWKLDDEQRDDMEFFVQAQDMEYLKIREEQAKKDG